MFDFTFYLALKENKKFKKLKTIIKIKSYEKDPNEDNPNISQNHTSVIFSKN